MEYKETLTRRAPSHAEMLQRLARFDELQGFDGGLADSTMPGCERLLYNVLGFQPPPGEGGALASPVGVDAARLAAIKISEGFNIGFCRALPGKGPMMHNHDTNETFIAITGRWRGSWEDDQGTERSIDLGPLDTLSFPAGAIRRFQNVTQGDPNTYSIIMFVIGGDAPSAEFTAEAVDQLRYAGRWSAGESAQR